MTKSLPPKERYRFCPWCGSEQLDKSGDRSVKCTQCGVHIFFNASGAIIAVITDSEGRILVARRAVEPAKGTLDFPGGFIDPGETAEAAFKREVKEELNLDISDIAYEFSLPNNYPFGGLEVYTIDMVFRAEVSDLSDLKAADDVSECLFIKPEDLPIEQFGLHTARQVAAHLKEAAMR